VAGRTDAHRGTRPATRWPGPRREVGAQEKELGVFFDTVIVCTVTGSTHAGMIAGTALEGRGDRRVIGIGASKTLEKTVD